MIAVLAAAMLAATSFAGSSASSGSVTIAIGGEPSTLDPLVRDDGN